MGSARRRRLRGVLPYVWSDAHARHVPGGEVYVGVHTPGTEIPERAERIRAALDGAGGHRVEAVAHPDAEALALHDPDMVAWLRTASETWRDLPNDKVVPYLFPTPGLVGDLPLVEPASLAARAGRWVYDTMTFVGPGTWEAARGAVDAALTAADLVLGGEPVAYALTRPPGHHVTRDGIGGSCYLNNSAAAAAHLHRRLGRPVALLDIDAHHGNGAQAIFRGDASVLTGSVHVDPAHGWFPHFLGFASESDASNRNLPLAPGTGDAGWLAAVDELVSLAFPASAVVVALGVDAAGGDPEAPLEVTLDGYREAGRRLGGIGVPTVVVQEGGYDLSTVGALVTAFLAGLVSAS
jgi:acetoin utilization deacetylase AcuC-like enzyme